MSARRIEMQGERFGRLRVLDLEGMNNHGHRTWRCRCDCGGETVAAGNELRRGKVQSCGCMAVEHGKRIGAATAARYAAGR